MTNAAKSQRRGDGTNSYSTLSLRIKLLLFAAALVIVPGALFGVIVQQSSHASLERVIGHQLAREAGHTGDRLTAVLRAREEIIPVNWSQPCRRRTARLSAPLRS
jgi:hypothetical protein